MNQLLLTCGHHALVTSSEQSRRMHLTLKSQVNGGLVASLRLLRSLTPNSKLKTTFKLGQQRRLCQQL
jgi:hypothetical protein